MARRALRVTVLLYVSSVVVLGTSPALLQEPIDSYLSAVALLAVILAGAYWAFVKIRPRTFGRFVVVVVTLGLLGLPTSLIAPASSTGTSTKVQNTSTFFVEHGNRDYANNCFLKASNDDSHSSSGYAVVSYATAAATSDGGCNGVGRISTFAYASGVYGSADAKGVLTFTDEGIFPAPSGAARYYSLNVSLDFLLNGWQTSRSAGLPAASGSTDLTLDFEVVDEQGSIVFDFARDWNGPQSLGDGELQSSYLDLGLMPAHSYSAVFKLSQTSSAWVAGLAGVASAGGCFAYNSNCSSDPFDYPPVSSFFCPMGAGASNGHCQDVQWRSMVFSLKAY